MPQKKLFAALLVAASALLMLGMSNENQIPYPSNYDTKSAGRRPTMDWPMYLDRPIFSSSIFIICACRLAYTAAEVPHLSANYRIYLRPCRRIDGGRAFSGTQRGR